MKLTLQSWYLARKEERAESERARVFGESKPTIVWANGRAVPVERRRIA